MIFRALEQSIDQYKIKVLVFSIQYAFKVLKYQYQYLILIYFSKFSWKRWSTNITMLIQNVLHSIVTFVECRIESVFTHVVYLSFSKVSWDHILDINVSNIFSSSRAWYGIIWYCQSWCVVSNKDKLQLPKYYSSLKN